MISTATHNAAIGFAADLIEDPETKRQFIHWAGSYVRETPEPNDTSPWDWKHIAIGFNWGWQAGRGE